METSTYLQYLKPSKRQRQKRRDKRLHEELIECGRDLGGKKHKSSRRKGLRRQRQRQARTGYPLREPMRTKGGNCSYPADNLQPLIRWLQSNTGCPWDKAYSHLIRQLDTRSAIGMHVIDHLWELVDVNTCLVDGQLVYMNQWGAPTEKHPCFFVHPETGLLQSNRYAQASEPLPKKEEVKRKKKKKSCEVTAYTCAAIQTKGGQLKEGETYTLETHSFTARIKLLADRSDQYYGLLFLEVLFLDCSLHFLAGMKDRLFYRESMGEPRWVVY